MSGAPLATVAVTPEPADAIRSWHAACDVLVVGYGCAGASAAWEGRQAGAEVLILESATGPGGASAMSGGALYLGGGTDIQKACGFSDTPDAMFKFLHAAMGPGADDSKLEIYCDESVNHFHWLTDLGLKFRASFWPLPHLMPPGDTGLVWMGENSFPFCELAEPAPRGHRPATEGLRGWLLMEKLASAVATSGAKVLHDTKVERLVVASDGRVVGVLARRYGETLALRAQRGVVLAGGGFVYNDEMLARYAPLLLGRGKIGTDADDGRVIRMAQAIGAALLHMDAGKPR